MSILQWPRLPLRVEPKRTTRPLLMTRKTLTTRLRVQAFRPDLTSPWNRGLPTSGLKPTPMVTFELAALPAAGANRAAPSRATQATTATGALLTAPNLADAARITRRSRHNC